MAADVGATPHVGRTGVEDNTETAELRGSNGCPVAQRVFEAFASDSDMEEEPPSPTYAIEYDYSDWEVEQSANGTHQCARTWGTCTWQGRPTATHAESRRP